jgi:peptidyl-prolyl cis-trans isomerase SurA
MKRIFLMWMTIYCVSNSAVYAQTLFTYGPYAVDKQEFLHAFQKNNTTTPSQKAYADYLELYIRYKLKVRAAYDMRLDTLPSQKTDLADYRKQVINNYMADEATLKLLVREAMLNSATDLRISHIYIPFSGNDSAAAKVKATRALQELKEGKSFETVAQLYSSDSSVHTNKGDIGWISAFMLPYPLEKLAYGTPLNTNSQVYKSSMAFHIFRRTGQRPAAGMIQVAQILLPITDDMNPEAVVKTYKLADSIYTALEKGANFGSLALTYSSDNASFNNQGVMQAFYPGTYDISFEEPVFALQKENELSKPFRTKQGLHIVKKLGVFRYATDTSNASGIAAMRSRVLNDTRSKLAIDAVSNKAAKQLGVKRSSVSQASLNAYTNAFFQGNAAGKAKIPPGTILATIDKQPVTINDYASYLSTNADKISNATSTMNEVQVFEQFMQQRILEAYQQNLEKFNASFAKQLNEFRDGNMIFEAMQANIWDKAVNDEAGLKRYYEQHRDKYTWKESVIAVIFNGLDSAAVQNFYTTIKGNPISWKSDAEKTRGIIQADSGRFDIDQLPARGDTKLSAGTITPPFFRAEDLTTNFIYVLHNMPANLPRNYEEAKGFVLNDYQSVLEEEWINALKKEYPVKINYEVLKTLNR